MPPTPDAAQMRYVVAPCRDAFVVIDTAATVTLPDCRLAVDGPFASPEAAAASCAALNRRAR